MKIASVHQSHYLPWIGLVDKIAKSDVHIVLDDVQYNKRSFQHRSLYSTTGGEKYLSLSVESKGAQSKGILIKDIKLSDKKVLKKHFLTLEQRYKKSIGWQEIGQKLELIYNRDFDYMLDLNMELLELTLDVLGIKPVVMLSSEIGSSQTKGALMYDLVNKSGCDTYLSGQGAKDYMDDVPEELKTANLLYQDFKHPEYSQKTNREFISGMFALEMFLEEGERARDIFREMNMDSQPYRSLIGD